MYPRLEQSLDLLDVARDWAQSMLQRPNVEAVLQLLLGAFWRGELHAVMPHSSDDPRPRLFDALRRLQPHPGFLIVDSAWTPLPPVLHPDGSCTVDIRRPLFWPQDPAGQTPEALEAAYAGLADMGLADYNDATQPILTMLTIARDEFTAFCQRKGYAPAGFWIGRNMISSSEKPNELANATEGPNATGPSERDEPVKPARPPARPTSLAISNMRRAENLPLAGSQLAEAAAIIERWPADGPVKPRPKTVSEQIAVRWQSHCKNQSDKLER